MSNQINDGGPAFPCVYYSDPIGSIGPQITIKGGMTLRDYFAAAALQGLLGNSEFHVETDVESEIPNAIATYAYQAADAMLKAREESK